MALKGYGVKGKLLAAVQSLYEEGRARVRVAGKDRAVGSKMDLVRRMAWDRYLLGGSGGMPPQENLHSRPSEIASGAIIWR